jgi:hypothetical protein
VCSNSFRTPVEGVRISVAGRISCNASSDGVASQRVPRAAVNPRAGFGGFRGKPPHESPMRSPTKTSINMLQD